MILLRPVLLLGFGLSFLIGYPALGAVDLTKAFEAAWENTESRALREAREEQVVEKVNQAKGAILPSLNFNATYLRQDTGNGSRNAATSAFTKPDQTTVKLTATQPLFRGLREFAALRATRVRESAESASTVQAKASLFAEVARAYYGVLSAASEVQSGEDLLALTRKQEGDLVRRQRIGRSREGDLLATRTQMASSQAQLEAVRTQLGQAREQFAFLTGLARETEPDPFAASSAAEGIEALENYLSRVKERPDLVALQLQVEAISEEVTIARSGHLPTLDALGNYYFKRPGALEDSKWDVGLSFTLPIFQGGVTQSLVREAAARSKEAELVLVRAQRDAEREIRSLYSGLKGELSQLSALKRSLGAASTNYRVQSRDYALGLVTNLEVLSALRSLEEAHRLHDRTQFLVGSSRAALEASLGHYPGAKGNGASSIRPVKDLQ